MSLCCESVYTSNGSWLPKLRSRAPKGSVVLKAFLCLTGFSCFSPGPGQSVRAMSSEHFRQPGTLGPPCWPGPVSGAGGLCGVCSPCEHCLHPQGWSLWTEDLGSSSNLSHAPLALSTLSLLCLGISRICSVFL